MHAHEKIYKWSNKQTQVGPDCGWGNVSKMPLHSKVKADDFMGRETTNCQNRCTDEYNHMGQASVNKVGPYFSHRGAIKMENVKRAVMMNLGSNWCQ